MVQTHHQTHESDQTQQKEDPSTTGYEDSKVGQSDQDSVGATSEVLSLQLVPLITQGQQNHLELMGFMRGVLQGLNSLTVKIGSSFVQTLPPVVVLEPSKPQGSDAQRVDRYVAPSRRDIELGQPLKGKEIAESPEAVGTRLNLCAPRTSNTLPSSVQSA